MTLTEQVILKFFDYGAFAVLFLFLLWWVLKTNHDREQKYIDFIHEMADKLDILGEIAETLQALKRDLDDLHEKIDRMERDLWEVKRKGGDEEE